MAKSINPRNIETTADTRPSDDVTQETMRYDCAVCHKPISNDGVRYVWHHFGERPDEHFHVKCFMPAPTPGANEPDGDEPKDFPFIIGYGISACMRQRTAHLDTEKEMDQWFRNLPASKSERLEKLRIAREQIETARLAIEAFYMRFRNLASTAKN